jgi:hypothetical protein
MKGLVSVLIVAALVASGCGGGTPHQTGTSTGATQPTSTTNPEAAEVNEAVLREANSFYPSADFKEASCEAAGSTQVSAGVSYPVFKCSVKGGGQELDSDWTKETLGGKLFMAKGIAGAG